jgi:hypothetical protein
MGALRTARGAEQPKIELDVNELLAILAALVARSGIAGDPTIGL